MRSCRTITAPVTIVLLRMKRPNDWWELGVSNMYSQADLKGSRNRQKERLRRTSGVACSPCSTR